VLVNLYPHQEARELDGAGSLYSPEAPHEIDAWRDQATFEY
jgi:hypothetical protein